MGSPEFPYSGNQLILSSDRVHLHAKNEYVVILGREGVVVSTPKEVHINSNRGVLVDAPIIELGHEAQELGEKVMLGETFVHHLTIFIKSTKSIGSLLETVGATNIADMASKLVDAGSQLRIASSRLENIIAMSVEEDTNRVNSRVLSKTTYTK